MKNFAWLVLALGALSLTGVEESAAQARARTPREQCNLNARNAWKRCVRSGQHGAVCRKARRAAYDQCRRTTPVAQNTATQPRR